MKFMLGNKSHDQQIREFLCQQTMPGHIQLSYERNPDFFAGLGIQGTSNQTIVALEEENIAGLACRSLRPMFVNSKSIEFGYLSGLRSSQIAKRKIGLPRGIRLLRELHDETPVPGYLMTIINENKNAQELLTSGRAGLPKCDSLGTCHTYAIPLNKRRKLTTSARRATKGEEQKVFNSLKELGAHYQFFPALNEQDLGTPLLQDLNISDFIVVEKDKQICGVAAIWNQQGIKQHRINKYSQILGMTRPILNSFLKCGGYHALPGKGEYIFNAYLCFKAAEGNSPDIICELINFACNELSRTKTHFLTVGFHEQDSSRDLMKDFFAIDYRSQLFVAYWQDCCEKMEIPPQNINFEPAIL